MIVLKNYLLVLLIFLRSFFGKKDDKIAVRSLFETPSYQIPKKAKKDRLIGLKFFKLGLSNLRLKGTKTISKSNSVLYVGGEPNIDPMKAYVSNFSKSNIDFSFSRQGLSVSGFFNQLFIASILCTWLPYFILCGAFSKNRASISFLQVEFVVWMSCLQLVGKSKANRFYFNSCFERDSNILALLLMKNKVEVIKIPSATSLKYFYKYLICDKVIFTAPFHQAESKLYNSNWVYSSSENWKPFGYDKLEALIPNFKKTTPKTLGFMSRGIWLRRLKGESSDEGEYEAEEQLLQDLKKYIEERKDVTLKIYLHPIEKCDAQQLTKSEKFYNEYFSCENIKIATDLKSSKELFDQYEIGISAYSSTNIERLYCNLKTLYAPYSMDNLLFYKSEIANICIKESSQFSILLDRTFEQSIDEFFELNDLISYSHLFYKDEK